MELSLHNLKGQGNKKRKKRVGRGDGSGSGTYSGRGQKGQKSRSGCRGGLRIKALRKVWKKIPKRSGFKSFRERAIIFNLEKIEKLFTENETISSETLIEKGLIKNNKKKIKILGKKINKKLNFSVDALSKSAEEAIKKIGGIVTKNKK